MPVTWFPIDTIITALDKSIVHFLCTNEPMQINGFGHESQIKEETHSWLDQCLVRRVGW